MKKTIFTFFTFIMLLSFLSACYTTRKGGCDCPGMSKKEIKDITKKS